MTRPTHAEAKAYSRGYAAGMRRAWPAYHPPAPPDPLAAEVMRAAIELAAKVANWCGAFGDDDEFSREMKPLLEAVDSASEKITEWLQSPQTQSGES